MTREHKLALIIGFALVLVVGLLITDNVFSTAKKSEPGGPTAQEIKQPIFDERVLLERPQSNQPVVTQLPANTLAEPATPGTLVMGTNQPGSGTDFGTRLGEAWNSTITDLGNGHVETAPAAQMDQKPTGGEPKAAFQTPETTPAPSPQPGSDSLFNTPQPVNPETVPGAPKTSGLNGAGSDLDGLGVPAPKPVEAKPTTLDEPTTARKDKTYQIASGDTFWKIAKREYGDGSLAEALKTYNAGRIGKNGQLRVGASLLLPEKTALKGGASGGSAKASELKVPSRDTIEKTSKKEEPKKTEAKKTETASKKATTYTVQKGDTLEKIAKKTLGSASRVEDLLKANRGVLDNEDEVQVGQVLKIPAR